MRYIIFLFALLLSTSAYAQSEEVVAPPPVHSGAKQLPPPLADVIEKVLQQAKIEQPDYNSKSKWSALMPRIAAWIGGNYDNNYDQSYRDYLEINPNGGINLDRSQSTANDKRNYKLNWKVMLMFDLQPLIYSSSDLQIEKEKRAVRQEKEKLISHTKKLYKDWLSSYEAIDREIAFQELVYLTDGWILQFYNAYEGFRINSTN